MTSLKYLQQVTVGQVEQNQSVKLVKYNNKWPQFFQIEREKIQQALGLTALKIEHIGSTAAMELMSYV